MDSLPLETLQRIFELACTDGGHTGHSLSLVSKDIRAASRTARFHSVALAASPRRLCSFVALYERECNPARGDKPRIRHLHVTFPRSAQRGASHLWGRKRSLSPSSRSSPSRSGSSSDEDWGPISPTSDAPSSHAAGTSAASAPQNAPKDHVRPLPVPPAAPTPFQTGKSVVAEHLKKLFARRASRRRLAPGGSTSSPDAEDDTTVYVDPMASPEYLDAAQRLFRLVAPDLVTLVIQCGYTFGGDLTIPIIERPFPLLREATFVGVSDPRTLLADGITAAPIFPAATHLYIVPAHPKSGESHLRFWCTNAPRVTHLGVSEAQEHLGAIAAAIGVQVKPASSYYDALPDDDSDDWAAGSSPSQVPPAPTYPSVRHLVLQPGPGPVGAWCGNAWMGHAQMLGTLRQVERDCAAVGVEVVETETPKDAKFSGYYEKARHRWLERIDDDRDEARC